MSIYPDTNRTIIERISAGDYVSWTEFFSIYSPVIRRLCEISGVFPVDIEDVVQEVMIRFFKQQDKFKYDPEKAKFRTYFNKIVRGAIADYFRSKSDCPAVYIEAVSEVSGNDDFESEFDALWRQSIWDSALREIASRVKSKNYLAFDMSVLQKIPIPEVAEFLQMSVDQVYVARSRIATELREIIARCREDDPELSLELPPNV